MDTEELLDIIEALVYAVSARCSVQLSDDEIIEMARREFAIWKANQHLIRPPKVAAVRSQIS